MSADLARPLADHSPEELATVLAGSLRRQREEQLFAALILREAHRRRVHAETGAGSFGHWAEVQGFGSREAWSLLQVAEAVELDERVGPAFLSGEIPLRSASLLPRALQVPPPPPAPAPEGAPAAAAEDWIDLAMTLPTERFHEKVCEAVASTRPTKPVKLRILASEEAVRILRRARRLAMRAKQEVLDDGQALEAVSRDYVERHDPRWRKARRARQKRDGVRRRGGARSRYVPAAVAQEVAERDDDACCVPFCPYDVFLDDGHVYVPYAVGGANDTDNLRRQCRSHNLMQQRGLIRVLRGPDGPIVLDCHGRVVERVRHPGRPARTLDEFRADEGHLPAACRGGGPDPPAPG